MIRQTSSSSNHYYQRGFEYLQMVRGFALESRMIDVMENIRDNTKICNWIGQNIDSINTKLNVYLQACHECFYPEQRRNIQIFAAPLAQSLGIDGLCNIWMQPVTILIDVGRMAPSDWQGLVAHEYAHAHVGSVGHNQEFAKVLFHICLGLGFAPPVWEFGMMEESLRSWPYCKFNVDPLAFWRGDIT
jgi:hypothetical protein